MLDILVDDPLVTMVLDVLETLVDDAFVVIVLKVAHTLHVQSHWPRFRQDGQSKVSQS